MNNTMLHSSLSDAQIRPALKKVLLAQLHPDDRAVVLEELGIYRGQVRADVAVVNGCIHAYEIKSERDSLRRLERQARLYGRCFDRASVVVAERHASAVQSLLPDWWGILLVEGSAESPLFRSIRPATDNPGLDPRGLAELLWREDAISLLEGHGLSRGMRSKPRRVIWDVLCDHLSVEIIGAAVRANLKARPARVGR